jgi:hypothetical protein
MPFESRRGYVARDDDGIRQYEAALKLDPANSAVRLNLALAYYNPRANEAPAAQTRRRIRPESKGAYLVMADCYLQTGQDQEVVALLTPRGRMFGDDLAYAYLLGTAMPA